MCWAQNTQTLGRPRRGRLFRSLVLLRLRSLPWAAIYPSFTTPRGSGTKAPNSDAGQAGSAWGMTGAAAQLTGRSAPGANPALRPFISGWCLTEFAILPEGAGGTGHHLDGAIHG